MPRPQRYTVEIVWACILVYNYGHMGGFVTGRLHVQCTRKLVRQVDQWDKTNSLYSSTQSSELVVVASVMWRQASHVLSFR